MSIRIIGSFKAVLPLSIFAIFVSFSIVGCAPSLHLGKPLAYQVRKASGEVVWRKNSVTKLGEEKVNIVVESSNLQKILDPENPSLSHIPLNLASMKVSSFGKWKTPDGSLFVLASSIQYDKIQDIYVLIDPRFSTLNGSDSIRLTANLKNGEKITVDIPNGGSIINHPYISLDGNIKR